MTAVAEPPIVRAKRKQAAAARKKAEALYRKTYDDADAKHRLRILVTQLQKNMSSED